MTAAIVILFCMISYGQQALVSSPVTVEWGRGHRCTGRAICSVSEASNAQYSNATLIANDDGQSHHLLITASELTATEIAFLFTPMSIEIDKVSKVDIGEDIVTILPGRYDVVLEDGDYKVSLTHAPQQIDD